jgi:hypothetical protein
MLKRLTAGAALSTWLCVFGVGCSTIREWVNRPPADPPPVEQPQNDDAVPFGNLRWNRGGENFAGAVRDSQITIANVAVRGTTLTYAGSGRLFDGSSTITHIWAIFFDDNRDGVFERGGKFDWGRANSAPRPLHHCNHGYKNWDGYPRSGTPWAAVITDKTGRNRSNVAAGVWP